MSHEARRAVCALALGVLLASCYASHTGDGTPAPDAGRPDSSRRDSAPPPPPGDGGFPCGDTICGAGEICCDACGGPPFLCAPAPAGCPTLMCPPPPPAGTAYVMDTLRLALADPVGDPDIVAGMNLDGRVSDGTDPVGCLHPDFASPPPDREPGVDNQLGPILSAIPFLDTEFARAIATGQWLVLIAVNDAPSARVIRLFRGHTMDGGPPRLSGGRIASDQTFFITQPLGELIADPADARTRTEPGRLSFPMHPLVSAPINFTSARLYGDFTREGVGQGVLGGAYPVGEAVDSLVEVDPDAIPHALARSVLDSMADSDVVVPSGECTAVSAAFTFTAVPATIELEP